MRLEVRKIGNSFGVIFPKKILEELRVTEGDSLYAIESEDGVTLTSFDPDFDKVMQAYDKFSKKYKNTLKALSK